MTSEERKIILQLRRDDDIARRHNAVRLMKGAADFIVWLDENGVGATYSTFCDDFGCESKEGEDRSYLYKRVNELIQEAKRRV